MYLDDGIGGSSSALETVSISEKMQRNISAAGLTINQIFSQPEKAPG